MQYRCSACGEMKWSGVDPPHDVRQRVKDDHSIESMQCPDCNDHRAPSTFEAFPFLEPAPFTWWERVWAALSG